MSRVRGGYFYALVPVVIVFLHHYVMQGSLPSLKRQKRFAFALLHMYMYN